MIHPGIKLIEEIRERSWTQKQFSLLVGKKNSEVNELIKGKRNITIQRDLILSEVLGTPEKYWINLQMDYDYEIAKRQREVERQSNVPEIVEEMDISGPDIISGINPDIVSDIAGDVVSDTVQDPQGALSNIDLGDSGISTVVLGSRPDTIEDASNNDQRVMDDIELQKMKELRKIFMNF